MRANELLRRDASPAAMTLLKRGEAHAPTSPQPTRATLNSWLIRTIVTVAAQICVGVMAAVATAQVFDLPELGPPVSDERGRTPDGLSLTEEGPNAAPEREAAAPRAVVPPPPAVPVPRLQDPRVRRPRVDLAARPRIRFLTAPGFPSFTELDGAGRPTGYHVELVRGLCETLEIADRCQIQLLPWAQLRPALARGDGEAIVAGLAVTAEAREELAFTEPYMRFPARFIVRGEARDEPPADGSRVAVVRGNAHAAMMDALLPRLEAVPVESFDALTRAVEAGEVDAGFGDGAALARWMAGPARGCCGFAGGPYLSEHYLGRGLAVATRAGDELAEALDWALAEMERDGRLEEIYLRAFPVSFY